MHTFIKQIQKIEREQRVAFTSKYPYLLPFILEGKRFVQSLRYTLNPKYKTISLDRHTRYSKVSKNITTPQSFGDQGDKWFQITEHSSPLYRKYNKKELDEGKIENIKIAIKDLDGIVILPGQTFSFWKHVGRSSKNRGFKKGLVLSAGRLKEDYGGGLCQLSNLIAYMFACGECAFVERKHHSKDVFPDYNRTIPFASGATVFYNLIDLKIKNTYQFPIQLHLRTTETQLRGSLSAPVPLDHFIKLEEKESYFFKSKATSKLYRCNTLVRMFYKKGTKEKMKEEKLWSNIAQVMYDETKLIHTVIPF